MRVRVGTSGYSYKEWKGTFYPDDLPAADMLRHYAGRLDTVEINNTFYRMPTEKLLLGWAEQVPPTFSIVLKAPQRITHRKVLLDVGEELSFLFRTASVLGERLGPMLFQLPPSARKNLTRLREFVALVPPAVRAAVEFRHVSWFDDEVYQALRAGNVALVASDTGEGKWEGEGDAPPVVPTASFGYLRLRREGYDAQALAAWAGRVLEQPWGEAWVFFKHEDAGTGPRLAAEFNEAIRARG